MTNRQIHPSAAPRGRRGIALFMGGALLLGLGATGCAALARGPASESAASEGQVSVSPATPVAPTGSTTPARPTTSVRPSPTASPTADPNTLADGVYPTYIRAVDVDGATITLDVLQTFFGADAKQAAAEDGVSWNDVRYDPVYIRDENPLLRTLRVAPDVKIQLIGVCMDPSRRVGLMKLREETTPFADAFYYDVSVIGGTVEGIQQLIAIAAC